MALLINKYSSAQDKQLFIESFLNFPKDIYPDKRHLSISLEKHYFFIHPYPHDFFLIYDNDKIVMRFMLCNTPHSGLAYFGLFDLDLKSPQNSLALNLFKKSCFEWTKSFSLNKILGPINFSTWLNYRFFSFSDGGPNFSFEPDRPVDYLNQLKLLGFKTNQIYSSKGYTNISNFIDQIKPLFSDLISKSFEFEQFPTSLNPDDLRDLYSISIKCFAENYLATPIDFESFKSLYLSTNDKSDLSYSFFCKSPSGERIAFFLAFVENQYIVAKTVGVVPLYRGMGLSNALMFLFLQKAQEDGITKMVAAMVKEGAQSESYGRKMPLEWSHLYEIIEISP